MKVILPARFLKSASLAFACFLAASAFVHAELTVVKQWPEGDNACSDSPLRITFNQPPSLGDHGRIEILRASDQKPVDSIDLGAKEFVDRYGAHGGYFLHFTPVQIEENTATIRL